jgi:hypothetical protein
MPRYDETWDTLVRRAVDQGAIDIRTMMERAHQMGMTEDALIERLEADLADDGSIFGKFLRSITGASEAAVVAASRQGELVGHLAEDRALARLSGLADVDDVIDQALDGADPEAAAALEESVADAYEETWICAFNKTCPRCLPLHGVKLLHSEWVQRGLLPEVMHDGWTSSCHCRLVFSRFVDGREELRAPLVRTKQKPLTSARGFRAQKKTLRAVLQNDIDKAMKARDDAMGSIEGRRTLRIAGQLNTLPENNQ